METNIPSNIMVNNNRPNSLNTSIPQNSCPAEAMIHASTGKISMCLKNFKLEVGKFFIHWLVDPVHSL